MKNIVLSTLTLVLIMVSNGFGKEIQTKPDIRIITADNSSGKITIKSIEKAFKANGFEISTNNDMSKSFEKKLVKKIQQPEKTLRYTD